MAQRISHKVALLAGAALGALGLTSNSAQAGGFFIHEPVSYTHLTLPTILRV